MGTAGCPRQLLTQRDGAAVVLDQGDHLRLLHGGHSAAHHCVAALAQLQEVVGILAVQGLGQGATLNHQPQASPMGRM